MKRHPQYVNDTVKFKTYNIADQQISRYVVNQRRPRGITTCVLGALRSW